MLLVTSYKAYSSSQLLIMLQVGKTIYRFL